MTEARKRVLLAENEPAIREIMTEVLEDHGLDVLPASDGSEAMRLYDNSDHVRLIVTDVNMPGADGSEVAQHARAHDPRIPVLFVSGRPETLEVAATLQPYLFLSKPFNLTKLFDAVDSLLKSTKRQRDS